MRMGDFDYHRIWPALVIVEPLHACSADVQLIFLLTPFDGGVFGDGRVVGLAQDVYGGMLAGSHRCQ